MKLKGFGVLGVILLALPGLVICQVGGTGSIQGVVSDTSGAIIPGANVSAVNVATDVKTTRQTTAAGYYTITLLPPGEYTVTATTTGFETTVQQKVFVDALGVV